MNNRVLRAAFHQVCFREPSSIPEVERSSDSEFDALQASAVAFLHRFDGKLSLDGKSVLDLGCGGGNLCLEAARAGARRVVGVDVQPFEPHWEEIERRYPELSPRIEIIRTAGGLDVLGDEQFEVVLSKDSFEHYPEPESFVDAMIDRLASEGVLAVHFAPLWKSPKGGHIDYMTRLPWAHLLFPEDVIMAERRRFRPDEDANRFEEVRGGLNKMTLSRFRALMAETSLECLYLATNASDRAIVRAMSVAARIPGLREYMTTSVTGLWRKPAS